MVPNSELRSRWLLQLYGYCGHHPGSHILVYFGRLLFSAEYRKTAARRRRFQSIHLDQSSVCSRLSVPKKGQKARQLRECRTDHLLDLQKLPAVSAGTLSRRIHTSGGKCRHLLPEYVVPLYRVTAEAIEPSHAEEHTQRQPFIGVLQLEPEDPSMHRERYCTFPSCFSVGVLFRWLCVRAQCGTQHNFHARLSCRHAKP